VRLFDRACRLTPPLAPMKALRDSERDFERDFRDVLQFAE
jgi:hypothetical protein